MRIFTLTHASVVETSSLPLLIQTGLPSQGFIWIACARREFEVMQVQLQAALQTLCTMQLVDLHISDLLSRQLPSHYDYTSQYDVLIFRRLAAGKTAAETELLPGAPKRPTSVRKGPPILRRIDTSPVAFAVFDRVLLTVHPTECAVRDAYAAKLLGGAASPAYGAGAKWPSSPADLMLRIVNQMVDGFLELRRELTRQLDHWQAELINPRTRFNNWGALLDARHTLHQLDEICEDQRAALQDWVEALKTWPDSGTPEGQRERDLLQVRSRDVLEHIERVVHHMRRLEQSIETAVQMHFNAQSHRTNEIMRVLTVLTAVFLPLNLIAGIFGMNFEYIPLLHQSNGFWWAVGMMVLIGLGLVWFFWKRNYLNRAPH